jgi:[ribosomal protein S5]-alanine N-acetyltransferase
VTATADDPGPGGYFLVSERLGFRAWRPDDIERAVALWGDPDVSRFVSAAPPPRADIEQRMAREMASQAEHGLQYWPIFLLADGRHVGCCGLRPYRPEQRIAELGVHILPWFWRQGLAREAMRAVIAHAFERLDATALFAGHNPHNAPSRALLRSLGFAYTHDEHYPPTDLMHPSYLLERSAWRSA